MTRVRLLCLCLLLIAAPVAGQSADCGQGLPCGPLPWRLPVLPVLSSPTPFIPLNLTATNGPTPTGTLAATATPTPDFSLGELSDQLATLQQIVAYDDQAPSTEEASGFTADNIGETLPIFFRFTHWIQDFKFGVFTPLIQVLVFSFGSLILFGLVNLIFPIIAPLIGLMRWVFDLLSKLGQLAAQIIQIIVQFIRG